MARLSEPAIGSALDYGSDFGSLATASQLERVRAHLDDALAKGARVLVGGRHRPDLGPWAFEPTVLTGATGEMRVANEETFGPLAPVFRFEDEAEAIELANATEFGLAAYLFTRDVGRVWRVGEALEFGIVGVNTGVFSYEGAPFGGVKQSGIGREGSHHGIDEFLEVKYLCLDGVDS